MARNVNADTVVFVASSWWQDSDPDDCSFFHVVSLSLKRTEREILRRINEEARNARDYGSYPTLDAAKEKLFWSGVFPERLGDYAASSRELDKAMTDLKRHGVWYPKHSEVHMIEAKQSDVVAIERMIDTYEMKGIMEMLAHVAEQKAKLLESGHVLEATKWFRAARLLDEATGKIARLNIHSE